VVVAASSLACCGGCGDVRSPSAHRDGAGPGSGGAAAANSGDRLPTAAETPSEAECREFAASVEKIALTGDAAGLNGTIDYDAIMEKGMAGIDAPEEGRRQFMRGLRQSLTGPAGLGSQVTRAAAAGGGYRLLRLRGDEAERRALFRLVATEGGVNYHEMYLKKCPDGKVRAGDIYVFLTAEKISDTVRRGFLAAAADMSRGFLERLTGVESEYAKNAPLIHRIVSSLQAGRYREVLQLYAQLPPSLQSEKSTLVGRLSAAQKVGPAEYQSAIDAFRKFHPNDPCVDMMSIDSYILQRKFAEAMACIDRLNQAVGGDPYLDKVKDGVKVLMQAPATAEATAAGQAPARAQAAASHRRSKRASPAPTAGLNLFNPDE
jgi:hypothetical protein